MTSFIFLRHRNRTTIEPMSLETSIEQSTYERHQTSSAIRPSSNLSANFMNCQKKYIFFVFCISFKVFSFFLIVLMAYVTIFELTLLNLSAIVEAIKI